MARNYSCKDCVRQFAGAQGKTRRECLSGIVGHIKTVPVRGTGIRDTATALQTGVDRGLKTFASDIYTVQPEQTRYGGNPEADGFWACTWKKKAKLRLIYTYHRESGGVAAYTGGKRD